MPTTAQIEVAPTPTELFRRSGIRVTRQRVDVLEELAREENDATAQQLFERLRARGVPIGLATVYRTLALLSERRVIDVLAHHSGELCYRLCGDHHHHHLMCSNCHRIVELQHCTLDEWVTSSAASHGFTATSHQVEIVGICGDCRI